MEQLRQIPQVHVYLLYTCIKNENNHITSRKYQFLTELKLRVIFLQVLDSAKLVKMYTIVLSLSET
jgi:hypothetical protein